MTKPKTALTKTKRNSAVSKFNATTFGILSRYTVMPWENRREYDVLCKAMLAAYAPVGPIEDHLVEELAGIVWRKQRIRLAEASIFRSEVTSKSDAGANNQLVKSALVGKASKRAVANGAFDLAEVMGPIGERAEKGPLQRDYNRVSKHLEDIKMGGMSYEEALAGLDDAWQEDYVNEYLGECFSYVIDGEETDFTYEELADDVAHYIKAEVLPDLGKQLIGCKFSEDISEHIQGMSFNAGRLLVLGKYETGLDRKLERMLSMLIKMQEIRGGGAAHGEQ